ncbi:MAG: hypothetical protein AB7E13_03525 [Arcobacteraceae bacterium]
MTSQKLIELNKKLFNLEKLVKVQVVNTILDIKNILHCNTSKIVDYEMELEISFYNSQEEVLAIYRDWISNINLNCWQVADGKNHNDFFTSTNHEMSGQKQCWLFHSLYDHLNLTIEQILTIEDIWWDINVSYQYGNNGFSFVDM